MGTIVYEILSEESIDLDPPKDDKEIDPFSPVRKLFPKPDSHKKLSKSCTHAKAFLSLLDRDIYKKASDRLAAGDGFRTRESILMAIGFLPSGTDAILSDAISQKADLQTTLDNYIWSKDQGKKLRKALRALPRGTIQELEAARDQRDALYALLRTHRWSAGYRAALQQAIYVIDALEDIQQGCPLEEVLDKYDWGPNGIHRVNLAKMQEAVKRRRLI